MKEHWLVGVDVGGTSIKMAVINRNGNILHKWSIPTNKNDGGKYIIKDIVRSLEETLKQHGLKREDLAGIGVGVPGPVNYEEGTISRSVNIGWPEHFPVRKDLERESGLPVFVENDANCAALGEMWKGSGKGARDLIFVTLGTGVGGGVIAGGKLVRGVNGAAGEIGHITSVPEGGHPCNCGKNGCLETIASARGIVRLAGEKRKIFAEKGKRTLLPELFTAKDVFDCARSGDSLCLEVTEEMSFHLGLALANLGNALNPEKIIIGGGVSKAGEFLLTKVQTYFEKYAFSPVRLSTRLALASLGNDAGVIGAARLVKEQGN